MLTYYFLGCLSLLLAIVSPSFGQGGGGTSIAKPSTICTGGTALGYMASTNGVQVPTNQNSYSNTGCQCYAPGTSGVTFCGGATSDCIIVQAYVKDGSAFTPHAQCTHLTT